jgi:hypothetical protein
MKPLSFAVHSSGERSQKRGKNYVDGGQQIACNSRILAPSRAGMRLHKPLFTAPLQQIDVMSTEDVVVGAVLAVMLALLASYLQGRGGQSDVVLWNKEEDSFIPNKDEATSSGEVFGAESWKDISRPENYILYNTEVRKKLKGEKPPAAAPSATVQTEKRVVVFALLALFVPVFSFEFFLSLSRQVICGGDPLTQTEWAQELCSPHFNP